MTPTPKLRFVERKVSVPFKHYDDVAEVKTARVLQQWWEPECNITDVVVDRKTGEWRDVPLEKWWFA